MDSILTSIKKRIGVEPEDDAFDTDIISEINTAFKSLNRLGVGPSNGFMIEDDTSIWTDFMPDQIACADAKTYIYLSVKLNFDPPTHSAHLNSLKDQISKLEWTMNVDAETE